MKALATVQMRLVWLLLGLAFVIACNTPERPRMDLDTIADRYVRLVLATDRHEPGFVDAYYGPPTWQQDAVAGDPIPLQELVAECSNLRTALDDHTSNERTRFLRAQLVAVDTILRRQGGESFTLSQQAELLYNIEAPVIDLTEIESAIDRIDALLPGEGELLERVDAFRSNFVVPAEQLDEVVERLMAESRRRTLRLVALPDGESFSYTFVHNKPWSGYNWYKGSMTSLIEFNTDLPQELGNLLRVIPHEGYPGHHTYNSLLESSLVQGRGWREFTVYPLYSPQSLIAEGTADAGVELVFPRSEWLPLMRDHLAPLAGLEGQDFERYLDLLEALEPLRYVRGEAARLLLDEDASEEEVIRFMARYALTSESGAKKAVEFIRAYGAYVYTYTIGKDLVSADLAQHDNPAERYFELLKRPTLPSDLKSSSTAR